MTLHWLNKETHAGEHAMLACRCHRGSHSFDLHAKAMTDVHSKFDIQDKVKGTTTDNCSIILKAFTQLGSAAESLPEEDVPKRLLIQS